MSMNCISEYFADNDIAQKMHDFTGKIVHFL